MVKADSPLLNQYISGLVIPAIREVQNAIFSGDYYAALRAHEVLLPLLWRHTEPLVVKARAAIVEVRNQANNVKGVDTESTLRDYHFKKQVLAERLSIELYYAVMGRINSEGFFELVTTVLGTSGGLSSGSKPLEAIPAELSNKV